MIKKQMTKPETQSYAIVLNFHFEEFKIRTTFAIR